MSDRLRIGLIGCGRIADRHLRRMVEDSRVDLALFCDPNTHAAKELVRQFAPTAAIEADETEAIDPSRVDIVVLCSPTTLHYRQASLAIERGLDVLTEKPMTSDAASSVALAEQAAKAGRLIGVAYQRRFESIYRTARRELTQRSERYGAVREIHVFVCERWSQTIEGTWRDDPAFSGGFFADAGSHQIDACFYITGQTPIELSAETDFRNRSVAITTTVRARLTGGIFLVAHFVGDANHWREDIIFVGETGDLVLRNGQEIERWSGEAMYRILDAEAGTSPNRDFIDAVVRRRAGGDPGFAAPASCGVVMAAWTEKVLASAQSGKLVQFDGI